MAPPAPEQQRVAQCAAHVRALNQQFKQWVDDKWSASPECLWSAGVADYLQHASAILEKYDDVVAWMVTREAGSTGKPPPTGNGPSAPPLFGAAGGTSAKPFQFGLANGTASNTGSGLLFSMGAGSKPERGAGAEASDAGRGARKRRVEDSEAGADEQRRGAPWSAPSEPASTAPPALPTFGLAPASTAGAKDSGTKAPGFLGWAPPPMTSSGLGLASAAPSLASTGLGLASAAPAVPLFGAPQGAAVPPSASAADGGNAGDEDEPEGPGSPSVKRSEEEGVQVLREARAKLFFQEKKEPAGDSASAAASQVAWKTRGAGVALLKLISGQDPGKAQKRAVLFRTEAGKVLLSAALAEGLSVTQSRASLITVLFCAPEESAGDADGGAPAKPVARTVLLRFENEDEASAFKAAMLKQDS